MTRNEIFRKMISWAKSAETPDFPRTVIQITRFLPDGCVANIIELSPDILTPKGRLRYPIRRAIDAMIQSRNDFKIQEILDRTFPGDSEYPLFRYDARDPGTYGRLFFDSRDFAD
jgi:hypothetical protein